MRLDYDTVYLGGTCYALSCASRSPEESVVLEAAEGLGGEFVDALFPGVAPVARPVGDAAAFYDELVVRGIMTEDSAAKGEIHMPAVNVVLNRIVNERGIHILFHARVIAIWRDGMACVVETVINGKIYAFRCRQVIDTRIDIARIKQADPAAKASWRANMLVPEGAPATGGWDDLALHKGFLPGESYLSMPCEGTLPPVETLLTAFERRPAAYMELRLLTLAHAPAITCAPIRERTEFGWFIPGCGFGTFMDAWAAGLSGKEAIA